MYKVYRCVFLCFMVIKDETRLKTNWATCLCHAENTVKQSANVQQLSYKL